jgi:protocatechuate 3,4-dioxygenase beta subunit
MIQHLLPMIVLASAAAGGDCELTRPDVEGPYWLEGSPQRSNLRIEGDGPLLDLHGTVHGNDCLPISGAWIDIWHADDEGDYDKGGWDYRGHFFADADGAWHLETVIPGLYPGRTAHIHAKVRGDSGIILTTQLYFPDLPENETDGFYHPDLEVLVLDEDADGNMVAEFHFVIDEEGGEPCPGDINGDTRVNVDDLLMVISDWNDPYDVDDLLAVIAGWGDCD